MNNKHQYSHHQLMVLELHERLGAYIGDWPSLPPEEVKQLRVNLIEEELDEFLTASKDNDLVEVADSLVDLLYVVYGTAIAWGIAIGPIFSEVHRTNMLKVGGPMRADGKFLPPNGWQSPQIETLLEEQIPIPS